MTQIFVLVAVAFVLLLGAIVFSTASDGTAEAANLTAGQEDSLNTTVDLLGTGTDTASLVPILILIALVATVLGVWSRL